MTDDQETTKDGPTRRSVLKRGTIAAGAMTVGVGAFSIPAAASFCPRTPGYWMNHDWPDTGLRQVNEKVSGVSFSSVEEGQEFLGEPKRGDKGQIMAVHLIATVLNFQQAGDCYDVTTEIADVADSGIADPEGKETLEEIKQLADEWLDASGWNMRTDQRSWIVPGSPVEDGEILKDYLDQFNNNNLLRCTCAVED